MFESFIVNLELKVAIVRKPDCFEAKEKSKDNLF